MNPLKRKLQQKNIAQNLARANLMHEEADSLYKSFRFKESSQKLKKVVAMLPHHFLAWYNLGECHRIENDLQSAENCYRRSLESCPEFYFAQEGLAQVFSQRGEPECAISCLKEILDQKPDYTPASLALGLLFEEQGEFSLAYACRKKAYEETKTAEVLFGHFCNYPPILRSIEHEAEVEKRLSQGLKELQACVDPAGEYPKTYINAPFYGAYHQSNLRILQEEIAKAYKFAFPDLTYTAPHVQGWKGLKEGQKIRLGFCSSYLSYKDHPVRKTFQKIITSLPKDSFDVVVFTTPQKAGKFEGIDGVSFVLLPQNQNRARQIIGDHHLDILIYPDLGMESFTYFLAYARLAPIQCMGSGHPMTSGIPTIDYFITSNLLDPEGAQDQYMESLLYLEGVPSFYTRPTFPTTDETLRDFELPERHNLYLCPQSLFKIHPSMDPVFREILRRDKRGILVTIESKDGWKNTVWERWENTIPDVLDRVFMIPSLPYPRFLKLMSLADVVLDTFPFGGGNTSYQALAAGIPIVTKPEETCRSRGTYALYHKMGFMGLIADSRESYIDLAHRLGTDLAFRRAIKKQIEESSHEIFDDSTIATEYARLMKDLVQPLGRTG